MSDIDDALAGMPIPDDLLARAIMFAALDGKDGDRGGGAAFIEGIAVGLLVAKTHDQAATQLALSIWTPNGLDMLAEMPDAAAGVRAVAEFIATGERAQLVAALE